MEKAALEIRQVMDDPRFARVLEYASLYIDRLWQTAASPEAFRYYQGLANGVGLLATLPDRLEYEARAGRSRLKAFLKGFEVRGSTVEPGMESVVAGKGYFSA